MLDARVRGRQSLPEHVSSLAPGLCHRRVLRTLVVPLRSLERLHHCRTSVHQSVGAPRRAFVELHSCPDGLKYEARSTIGDWL